MTRFTRLDRAAVGLAVTVGLGALAYGPVRVILQPDERVTTVRDTVLGSAPLSRPKLGPWPLGVYDSAPRSADMSLKRIGGVPVLDVVPVSEAFASIPTQGYVAVSGQPGKRALPGVGSVVTERDVQALLALAPTVRDGSLTYLTGLKGAALAVIAAGGPVTPTSTRVTGESSRKALGRISREHALSDLIDGWAQSRPDLSVYVAAHPRIGGAPGTVRADPLPGTRLYRDTLARIIRTEILRPLLQGRPVVADRLFGAPRALFDLTPAGLAPTLRGSAYLVAAKAIAPGSVIVPARTSTGVTALVVRRPDGGGSVLVWNPGPARTFTLDTPGTDAVNRYRVPIAGTTFTAINLAPVRGPDGRQ